MEETQTEIEETPHSVRNGFLKFAAGIVASAIVTKLVDNAIDALSNRRNRDKTEPETAQ
jgi:hypothetical protein